MGNPIRQLRDPRTIRALAHPLRLTLLELLFERGAMTATDCAELVGESPASCSFHLRQLAKYGYVEEAEGGKGRQRPWQAVQETTTIPSADLSPEALLALDELDAVMSERAATGYQRWQRVRRQFSKDWQLAAFDFNVVAFLTLEQAAAMKAELRAVLMRYADLNMAVADRPKDAVPLGAFGHVFPMCAPDEGTAE